jgi:hypothetical protein
MMYFINLHITMERYMVRATLLAFALTAWCGVANAETPDEWVSLGTRVHGGFGAFIPLGIKIGLDAVQRLNTKPRELSVLYYDSDTSPCACFADGIAIATYASVGQRTSTIAPEKAPAGDAAVDFLDVNEKTKPSRTQSKSEQFAQCMAEHGYLASK